MRASHQRHVPVEGPSCSYHSGAFHSLTAGRSKICRIQAAPFGRAVTARIERPTKVLHGTLAVNPPCSSTFHAAVAMQLGVLSGYQQQ